MALLLVGASPGSITECSMHRHACYELIMNTEGEGIAEIGGTEYPFTPGTIHIVPPNMPHRKRSSGGFRDLYFHTDTLQPEPVSAKNAFAPQKPISLADDVCHTMEKILSVLLERYLLHQRTDEITEALYGVALQLIEEWTRDTAPDHVIRQLIHTITVSYSDPDFHVTEALTATGYSKDHIRRQFHQFTGMTPNEYLTDIRIQYAKRLLRQKNKLRLPVSEIAWMCGFYDAAYFCRLFRKHVGVSPSEYSTSFLH